MRSDPKVGVNPLIKRFLLPLSECEFTFNSILDDLQSDPWVPPSDSRPQRCTGSALNIALALMEASHVGGRMINFIGGPCTIGPGQVVDIKLEMTIRNYYDLQKDNSNCIYYKKALKFYQELTQRAIQSKTVIDMLAFSLDQYGLIEMKPLVEKTGGYVVVHEEFNSNVFKDSYKKFFELDQNNCLKMAFDSKIDVIVSKDLRICGAIGPCTSLKKGGPMVAESEIGQGLTSAWFLGGMDKTTTVAFYFEQNQDQQKKAASKIAYFQYQTIYRHSNGEVRLRITTVQRKFADENKMAELAAGFDQETACVAMARLGVLKAEVEEPIEVLKWLDRSLIRLICRFAEFKKDQVSSFRLNQAFSLYPQFMYHLRRSHFIQVFGTSPDEASFYKCTLLRENITNSLVMIQPALLQYNFDDPNPIPVTLDIESLKNNVILLLDTYFNVLIWHGDHIQKWKDKGFQDLPEYEDFKNLLQAPVEDVKLIMEDRFPSPLFLSCGQGSGKERYLKSKVNPSSMDTDNSDSGNYITDDASLKVFMDHLIKLVVQSAN